MNEKERNIQFDVLRIMATIFVVILHYNNSGIGGGFKYVNNLLNYVFLVLIESISICAVNVFVIISSHFLIKSNKRNYSKIIKLLFLVILFKSFYNIMSCVYAKESVSLSLLIKSFVPSNWYIMVYISLYILSPYLNTFLNSISLTEYRKLIPIIVCLFSIYPTLVDLAGDVAGISITGLSTIGMQGSQNGYTIINFVLLYLLVGYSNRCGTNKKTSFYALLFSMCSVFIALLFIICGHFSISTNWLIGYSNPLVIITSLALFELSKKVKITLNRKIIRGGVQHLSKASLIVYLTHCYFLQFFCIENFVNKNIFVLILHILFTCICVYFLGALICLFVDPISDKVANISKKLFMKR